MLRLALTPIALLSLVPQEQAWVQTWLRPTPDQVTVSELHRLSTEDLARRLLPASVAQTVTSHRVADNDASEGRAHRVDFRGPLSPIDDDLCRQTGYVVSLKPVAETAADTLQGESVASRLDIALAAQCQGPDGWQLSQTNVSRIDETIETLRWLAAARVASAGDAALPFELSCKSPHQPDACADGARKVLAALPMHRVFSVGLPREGTDRDISVTPSGPGHLYWRIRIMRPPQGRPRVDMEWTVPAPF